MRVAALCAGYGGLEMGLHLSGVNVDLVWYSEIDRHASQVMEHHHPGVPNLGDLTAIEDCPQVDIVTAGFPCQPVSQAGKRKGVNDERWLIDDVVRVACRADARWLVLENVAGILTANRGDAFYHVLRALAEGGFVAEWVCVRASDVGAPHQRLRWFCVAHADESSREARGDSRHESERFRTQPVGPAAPAADADGDGHGQGSHTRGMGRVDGEDAGDAQQRERARSVVGDRGSEAAADADARRRTGRWDSSEELGGDNEVYGRRRSFSTAGRGETVSDADSQRAQVPPARRQPAIEMSGSVGETRGTDWGPYTDAIRRWEPVVGRPAPNPTDDQRRLNPRFVEWMMGLPDGWVCDAVEGRSHQLRILGNGVVPQQAALAITELFARLEDHE